MRVFIGGAHNGKRAYVRNLLKGQEVQWFDGTLPGDSHLHNLEVDQLTVIAGLEKWLAETDLSEVEAIAHVMEISRHRDVIFILTDIGRGIVPMNKEHRALRDTCGRLYQRLIEEADEVTRIWYGLAQNLKKRGEKL